MFSNTAPSYIQIQGQFAQPTVISHPPPTIPQYHPESTVWPHPGKCSRGKICPLQGSPEKQRRVKWKGNSNRHICRRGIVTLRKKCLVSNIPEAGYTSLDEPFFSTALDSIQNRTVHRCGQYILIILSSKLQ